MIHIEFEVVGGSFIRTAVESTTPKEIRKTVERMRENNRQFKMRPLRLVHDVKGIKFTITDPAT